MVVMNEGRNSRKEKRKGKAEKGSKVCAWQNFKNLAGFNFFSASIKNIGNGVSSP